MNAILQSPSAMIFFLALVSVVVLQVSGDVIEVLARRKKLTYKPHATYYIPDTSMTSALLASNRQLRNYRNRVVAPYGKTKTIKLSHPRLRLSLTPLVIALIIATLILLTEGFIVLLTFTMACTVLMAIVGLLAWHPSPKMSRNDKLAIALLAPYVLFVK